MTTQKFHAATRDRQSWDKDGYSTITPGTSLNDEVNNISRSTLYRWERKGWIRKCGEDYVLTHKGYQVV